MGPLFSESDFLSQYHFQPLLRHAIGVEREFFLSDARGVVVPASPRFLAAIKDPAWTYELSACQVEHRTAPALSIDQLRASLDGANERGREAAQRINLQLTTCEVAASDMPLDVYPDEPRYASISQQLSHERLVAACRVTGTHIHVGVASIEEAIAVANKLSRYLDDFIRMGDHSNGERVQLYQQVAPRWRPPHYESTTELYREALEHGFVQNPRDCWHMIRMSRHGTVEVRAFGVTESTDEIIAWVERVLAIART